MLILMSTKITPKALQLLINLFSRTFKYLLYYSLIKYSDDNYDILPVFHSFALNAH